MLAKQGSLPSNGWPTPYDTYPVFDKAVNGLAKQGDSPQQALDVAVKGCQDLITKYLSSSPSAALARFATRAIRLRGALL